MFPPDSRRDSTDETHTLELKTIAGCGRGSFQERFHPTALRTVAGRRSGAWAPISTSWHHPFLSLSTTLSVPMPQEHFRPPWRRRLSRDHRAAFSLPPLTNTTTHLAHPYNPHYSSPHSPANSPAPSPPTATRNPKRWSTPPTANHGINSIYTNTRSHPPPRPQ